jgi:hypothetical protein
MVPRPALDEIGYNSRVKAHAARLLRNMAPRLVCDDPEICKLKSKHSRESRRARETCVDSSCNARVKHDRSVCKSTGIIGVATSAVICLRKPCRQRETPLPSPLPLPQGPSACECRTEAAMLSTIHGARYRGTKQGEPPKRGTYQGGPNKRTHKSEDPPSRRRLTRTIP